MSMPVALGSKYFELLALWTRRVLLARIPVDAVYANPKLHSFLNYLISVH